MLNYLKKIFKILILKYFVIRNIYNLRKTIFNKIINQFRKKKVFYNINKSNKIDKSTNDILLKIKQDLVAKNLFHEKKISPNVYNIFWNNFDERKKKGDEISKIINTHINKEIFFNKTKIDLLNKISNDGFVEIPSLNLEKNIAENIENELHKFKVYPSHTPWQANSDLVDLNEIKMKKNLFASYDIKEIFKFPEFIKVIFNENLLSLISSYFNCVPTLCSVNLYWNFNNKTNLGPRFFHRDVDDYKIMNFFWIMTDTQKNNGDYVHIKHTHSKEQLRNIMQKNDFANKIFLTEDNIFELPLNGYGYSNLYNNLFKDYFSHCYGDRGKAILADGYGLHKANNPENGRLIFWATYSLTNSSAEIAGKDLQEKINYNQISKYVPNSIINRYVGRNLINF